MKKVIGVVDYGVGNQSSLISAIENINCRVVLSNIPDELETTEIIVLPGVGAFKTAIEDLKEKKISDYLKKKSKQSKPIIGICLGMQLLCSSSLEYGFNEGLDIIPGKILPLKKHNIGWAKIKGVSLDVNKLDIENEYFYFNHGFYFEGQKKYISSKIHDSSCPSIIKYKNNIGLQFHPEKSQLVGKKFLTNLLHGYFDD